jgi:hypothetical protein
MYIVHCISLAFYIFRIATLAAILLPAFSPKFMQLARIYIQIDGTGNPTVIVLLTMRGLRDDGSLSTNTTGQLIPAAGSESSSQLSSSC